MRKLAIFFALVAFMLIGFQAIPLSTSATGLFDVCSNPAPTGGPAPSTSGSAVCVGHNDTGTGNPISGPNGIIIKVTNIISLAAGAAAVILLIIAGIKYITSQGDSAGVKAAKASLINIAIGIVVIVLGRQFIVFIVSRI